MYSKWSVAFIGFLDILLVIVLVLLVSCTKQATPRQRAEEALFEIKSTMSTEYSEAYFQSEEWLAFEEAYWQGFEEGQEYYSQYRKEVKD